jgi:hypothetical protein
MVRQLAGRKYKIKGVEENDQLTYIGSLFRHAYSSDWHLQVRFKKSQKKSVLASLLPDLAVGRTYNLTDTPKSKQKITLFNWSNVVSESTGEGLNLPSIPGIYRNERYFVLEKKQGYLAIPQLELARVLFLQNSKMFHYALDSISLGIDFQSFQPDEKNLLIEVNSTTQLSKNRFEQIFNPSKLAYTLCDKAGKESFLSIAQSLLKNRLDAKNEKGELSTWWAFSFNVPTLSYSKLKACLYRSPNLWKGRPVHIVTEVFSLTQVPNSLPENIHIFSRDWLKISVQQGKDDSAERGSSPEYFEVNDAEAASCFLPEKIIQSLGESEFTLDPKRKFETLTTKKKIHLVVDGIESDITDTELASTDLSTLLGTATPVVSSSNTEYEADESVFEVFKAMIQVLDTLGKVSLVNYEIRRLNKVGNSRLQNRQNGGGSRLAAIAHFRRESLLESYSLIEIDLSDYGSKKPLSTLLFKYSCLDEARGRVDAILSALVGNSLKWPRDYFKSNKIVTAFIDHKPGLHSLGVNDAVLKIDAWATKVGDSICKI